ncbi:MAG: sensor domain-containing protein [Solirubrobacterales bacterium]|nr:sensor domain-containing protein [Solirubrobacterales bacterium]MBV9807556.1 sensor domain-containing protein [Solirubrobacterales bacterium]
MELIMRTLADPVTYRRLVYLVSALVLGPVWFIALVMVWSLCLGLAITPFVIPMAIVLAYMTRGFAAVEAELARSLLDVEARAPAGGSSEPGFWAWLRGLFAGGFWRAQAYLMLRWFAGFPVALIVVAVLATGLGMLFAPAWVPFVQGGAHLGFWRPHTFLQSLALVPAGLVVLPLGVVMAKPLAIPFEAITAGLLNGEPAPASTPVRVSARRPRPSPAQHPRQALETHAAVDAIVVFALVLIWVVTSRGYFWPVWVALPLAAALGIHAWLVLFAGEPGIVRQFRGSHTLAASVGVGGVIAAYFTAIWAITGHGYFWPVWPILAIVIMLAVELAAVLLMSPRRAEMAERIETLETSRAGAVDAQETELRRIERDLHDGAQARLVALGMSLGMAEQKLTEDPHRAGELLAEARLGAEHALRELRDLARGIHPPVLADRGLEAALASLASSTPLRVGLSVDVAPRPAPAVESAAYFVAAEALANAAKHARAHRVDITVVRDGDALELEVRDDGAGGADPAGTGLLGLQRRVEALDGSLTVTSPPGGPTTIRAELPCG